MKAIEIIAQLGNCRQLGLPCVVADEGAFQNILSLVFIAIGAAALGFIVYGALRYVVSAGSPEDTKKAKDIIVYAVVGLVVSVVAFTIVNFIASRF